MFSTKVSRALLLQENVYELSEISLNSDLKLLLQFLLVEDPN